ncbi:dynamin family protein [Ligilactobacillus faecis]|uniref:Dynamin family protein n=1 Tax=Ligilactobacillus faecis TaxID=762833 RepID=A0ABV4DQF7_9LACO
MDFQDLKEAASYLGENLDLAEIEELENIQKAGKIYLTVWGHYSAGKSKLLNKILGVDLLPTKTRETTAVLTYLEFGTDEGATIFFEDGRTEEIELSILKLIFQNTVADIDIDEIKKIVVSLNNPLLKNGIVLVDTPGINTLLERHNLLAASTINQAGKILYVLGRAPSEVDKKFIKEIISTGTEITFVRTKADSIDPLEEDVDEALMFEKNLLTDISGKDSIEFVAVSSEENSELFANISQLRDKIMEIQKNTAKEIEEAVTRKAQVYIEKYITELTQKNEDIKLAVAGNKEELDKKIAKKESQIAFLSKRLKNLESRLTESTAQAKKDTQERFDILVGKSSKEFRQKLQKRIQTREDVKIADNVYAKELERVISKAQTILNDELNKLLADNYPQIEEIDNTPPTYQEAVQDVSSYVDNYKMELQSVKSQLEQKITELETLRSTSDRNDEDIQALQAQLLQVNDQLAEIPTTPTLYSEELQTIKPSTVLEKIGDAVDIALMFVKPNGKAATKLGKDFAKLTNSVDKNIARFLRKAHRATQETRKSGIGKAMQGLSKEARAGKKYKDAARMMREGITQKVVEDQSVLDILSVSHWTRMIGEQFDVPPRLTVDTEEEQNRLDTLKKLNSEKRSIRKALDLKEKGIEDAENKRRSLEREIASLSDKKRELSLTVKAKEEEADRTGMEKSLKSYISDYVEYFNSNISTLVDRMHTAYFNQAVQNIGMYIASTNRDITQQLEEQRDQLEKLVAAGQSSEASSLEQEIARNNELIAEFKEFDK